MDSKLLKDKRVLLFIPYTFNYQDIILEKIKQLGAEVYLYDEINNRTYR